MGNKLRINDLAYDSDDLEDDLFDQDIEPRQKIKQSKPKKNKSEFSDFSSQRQMKRRVEE